MCYATTLLPLTHYPCIVRCDTSTVHGLRELTVHEEMVFGDDARMTLNAHTEPGVATFTSPVVTLDGASGVTISGDLTLDVRDKLSVATNAWISGTGGGLSPHTAMPGCPNDGGNYVGGSHGGYGGGPSTRMTPCGSNMNWPRARGAGGRSGGAGACRAAVRVPAVNTSANHRLAN